MKLKLLLVSAGIVVMSLLAQAGAAAQPATVNPNEDAGQGNRSCSQYLLTFPAWYRGLLDGNCEVVTPTEVGGVSGFIWAIALNVIEMILNLAGYAAVAYVIYGGYKYMISAGSSDGMVGARKTILNALIGLAISIAAIAIVRTLAGELGIGS